MATAEGVVEGYQVNWGRAILAVILPVLALVVVIMIVMMILMLGIIVLSALGSGS